MKWWQLALAAGAAAGLLTAQPVFAADSQVIRNEWQDEHLGPGVARWVDEDGNAVSYTHLDVYKRQPQRRLPTRK